MVNVLLTAGVCDTYMMSLCNNIYNYTVYSDVSEVY